MQNKYVTENSWTAGCQNVGECYWERVTLFSSSSCAVHLSVSYWQLLEKNHWSSYIFSLTRNSHFCTCCWLRKVQSSWWKPYIKHKSLMANKSVPCSFQRKLQLGYQSGAGKLRNWAVGVSIHVVVAAHVETKNWIAAGTLLPWWEHSRQDIEGSSEANWSKYQRNHYRQHSHLNAYLMGIDSAFNLSRENRWGGKLVAVSVNYHKWLDTVKGMVLFLFLMLHGHKNATSI